VVLLRFGDWIAVAYLHSFTVGRLCRTLVAAHVLWLVYVI
jgi:hypothetical protein